MSETGLKIRVYGDTVLRKKVKLLKSISARQRETLSQMARIMYAAQGVGLAAPQVGVSEPLIVVDVGSGLYKLVNPRVIKKEGHQIVPEGCLSVPDVCIKVKRAKKVVIRAQDESGKKLDIEAEDLLACAFQHEIDHLQGKLIIDHASLFEKFRMKNRLEKLKREAKDEQMPQSESKSCQLQL